MAERQGAVMEFPDTVIFTLLGLMALGGAALVGAVIAVIAAHWPDDEA